MAPQDWQNCGRNFAKCIYNQTQSLRKILRMVIFDVVIHTIIGRLTLDPPGMRCPSWDDAFVSSYRQDCRAAANCRFKFTHRPKNQGFRPTGATRCTDSRQSWQGRRAVGSAWPCKISPELAQGVGMRPLKYQQFPLFGKESPRRGDSLDRFRNFITYFIHTTIMH